MPITGQVCFSLTRILVPKSRRKEITEAYVAAVKNHKVGDPFDPATTMGPLAMGRQLERVLGYIEKGKNEGVKLLTGGGRMKGFDKGFFIEPTVFGDVDANMTIAQEEIFGPVASFIEYDGIDDAVRKANSTIYGLHGAVYTQDPSGATRSRGACVPAASPSTASSSTSRCRSAASSSRAWDARRHRGAGSVLRAEDDPLRVMVSGRVDRPDRLHGGATALTPGTHGARPCELATGHPWPADARGITAARRTPARGRGGGRRIAMRQVVQQRAVRQLRADHEAALAAVLQRMDGQHHLVAGLERALAPAVARQVVRLMPSSPYSPAILALPSAVTVVQVCGFVHWNSLTVAVSSTVLEKSNMAVE